MTPPSPTARNFTSRSETGVALPQLINLPNLSSHPFHVLNSIRTVAQRATSTLPPPNMYYIHTHNGHCALGFLCIIKKHCFLIVTSYSSLQFIHFVKEPSGKVKYVFHNLPYCLSVQLIIYFLGIL